MSDKEAYRAYAKPDERVIEFKDDHEDAKWAKELFAHNKAALMVAC